MSARTFHLFPACTIILLGWGALAFGSEYAWAYAVLIVLSIMVSLLGLLASPVTRFPSRACAFALVAVFIGGVAQLVPLSRSAVATVSPASMAVDYRQLYRKATMQATGAVAPTDPERLRPVSIAPWRTVLGLTFLLVFTALLIGAARAIGALGPAPIARGILVLGVVVAIVNLAQRALGSETIYGLWYSPKGGVHLSAPFVNRNHTAGWLIMAWALAAGHFAGCVACGLRGVKRNWRHRLLWLSSPEASEMLLTGFTLAVMATAIVVSASRSGFLCLVLAVIFFAWSVLRRQDSSQRRAIGAMYLVFVLFIAATWGGVDAVIGRFQVVEMDLETRLGTWHDTLRIIRDFPFTGTGFNTYGIAMLHYQTLPADELMIEAHNDYLQIVAEGGLLLSVPILLTLILFIREVRRRFRERVDDTRTYWLRAGAVIGLCAVGVQETVEFTLQMPGAAALFVIFAAIAIHRPIHSRHSAATAVRVGDL